ncbi:MAG: lipid-A-disaccharide synthase [Synergistaceae bacterium]|jgi:lipid-A-disaccharide synthase|nr:lipid-A-disaccharide synthase [Synergistaceae bacterium]
MPSDTTPLSIFLSCGEISGDLYAADLTEELLRQVPALAGNVWGMMGPRTVAAGGDAVWSYEELKLMGIAEVLPAVPRLLKLRNRMARSILERNPSAVVVVDSPDFHLSLVKKLRLSGYRGLAVCLVTPTVWAWRSGRTKLLRSCFDICLPLFSFEHEFLLERGVASMWTAHPLVEALKGYEAPAELADRYRGERVVALMAGSRGYDIRYHLTQLIGTAALLKGDGFLPVFSIAPGLSPPLRRELRERTAGFESWDGEGRGLMKAALAVAGVSGTVAVEAMLLRRFMVVIYNGRGISWLIARALVRIPWISIPNYLTDGPVYPELLKGEATPERIVCELRRYLDDPAKKAEIDRKLEGGRRAMGSARAAIFWAESILNALDGKALSRSRDPEKITGGRGPLDPNYGDQVVDIDLTGGRS